MHHKKGTTKKTSFLSSFYTLSSRKTIEEELEEKIKILSSHHNFFHRYHNQIERKLSSLLASLQRTGKERRWSVHQGTVAIIKIKRPTKETQEEENLKEKATIDHQALAKSKFIETLEENLDLWL